MLNWENIVTFQVNETHRTINLVFNNIPTGPDKILWNIIESSTVAGQHAKSVTDQIISILSEHYTSCNTVQELVDTLVYQHSVIWEDKNDA